MFNQIFKIFKYSICFIILIPIYLISPFLLIRFSKVSSEIIGGFAENTETYLCKKYLQNKKFQIDLFCFGKISNNQLAKMIKREIIVLPSIFINVINFNKFISKYFPYFSKHNIDLTNYRDIENLYRKVPQNIKFTDDEIIKGWKLVEKFGIFKETKYICLVIRDDEYKKKTNFLDFSSDYHDFRNFNSDNFIPAAEELANRGLKVIRMGKHVSKKFISKNKNIIDYANSEFRSDFLDIFLGAHCSFCLTTATGIDTIPLIFRKPIAAIVVPLAYFQNYNDNFINISKHHFLNGVKLNAEEIFLNNLAYYLKSDFFKKKNVILQEPNPDEIKEFALEAYEIFINKKDYQGEDLLIQKNFQKKYREFIEIAKKKDPLYLDNIQPLKIKGYFGTSFLKKNNFF